MSRNLVKLAKSYLSSWGKIEYAVIGVIGILLIGRIGSLLLNRDPYICSEKQREQVISTFDPIISSWDDANSLASSTSRINLTTPVSNLQNIQRQVRELEILECAQPVKDKFLDMSQETINSYLLFMRDESDSIVQGSFISAEVEQDYFITYYTRLKEGKTLDPYEVIEENTEQFIQESEQSRQELEKN